MSTTNNSTKSDSKSDPNQSKLVKKLHTYVKQFDIEKVIEIGPKLTLQSIKQVLNSLSGNFQGTNRQNQYYYFVICYLVHQIPDDMDDIEFLKENLDGYEEMLKIFSYNTSYGLIRSLINFFTKKVPAHEVPPTPEVISIPFSNMKRFVRNVPDIFRIFCSMRIENNGLWENLQRGNTRKQIFKAGVNVLPITNPKRFLQILIETKATKTQWNIVVPRIYEQICTEDNKCNKMVISDGLNPEAYDVQIEEKFIEQFNMWFYPKHIVKLTREEDGWCKCRSDQEYRGYVYHAPHQYLYERTEGMFTVEDTIDVIKGTGKRKEILEIMRRNDIFPLHSKAENVFPDTKQVLPILQAINDLSYTKYEFSHRETTFDDRGGGMGGYEYEKDVYKYYGYGKDGNIYKRFNLVRMYQDLCDEYSQLLRKNRYKYLKSVEQASDRLPEGDMNSMNAILKILGEDEANRLVEKEDNKLVSLLSTQHSNEEKLGGVKDDIKLLLEQHNKNQAEIVRLQNLVNSYPEQLEQLNQQLYSIESDMSNMTVLISTQKEKIKYTKEKIRDNFMNENNVSS